MLPAIGHYVKLNSNDELSRLTLENKSSLLPQTLVREAIISLLFSTLIAHLNNCIKFRNKALIKDTVLQACISETLRLDLCNNR